MRFIYARVPKHAFNKCYMAFDRFYRSTIFTPMFQTNNRQVQVYHHDRRYFFKDETHQQKRRVRALNPHNRLKEKRGCERGLRISFPRDTSYCVKWRPRQYYRSAWRHAW